MIKAHRIQEIKASRNILYTTIKIEDEEESATGFFYHIKMNSGPEVPTYIPLLVTNSHVIEGKNRIELVFHLGPEENFSPLGGVHEYTLHEPESKFIKHPRVDLCAMNIDAILREIRQITGKDVYYQALSTDNLLLDTDTHDLWPIEDVYMIGYPRGLWDKINNLPIARKGITASHPRFDFNGEPKGLVDIAAFGGSSGSPIILVKELGYRTFNDDSKAVFLLGILEEMESVELQGNVLQYDLKRPKKKPQPVDGMVARTEIMMHIGRYIRSRVLLDLEPLFF
jgi:hypothetical protein